MSFRNDQSILCHGNDWVVPFYWSQKVTGSTPCGDWWYIRQKFCSFCSQCLHGFSGKVSEWGWLFICGGVGYLWLWLAPASCWNPEGEKMNFKKMNEFCLPWIMQHKLVMLSNWCGCSCIFCTLLYAVQQKHPLLWEYEHILDGNKKHDLIKCLVL